MEKNINDPDLAAQGGSDIDPGYRYEERHLPAIYPSLLFTDSEVKKVDWEAVFRQW